MKTIEELTDARLRGALEAVKAEVVRIAGAGAKLILYGSHARGEGREDSDVDLMVVLPDEKATFKIKDGIRDAIFEIGYEADLLLSTMGEMGEIGGHNTYLGNRGTQYLFGAEIGGHNTYFSFSSVFSAVPPLTCPANTI